jgi:hypothetical protein
MHELSTYAFELPSIDEWFAGDDRTLAFTVTDADGNAIDISNATVEWGLFEREYQDDAADAVLSGSDSGVELVTDNRVDSEAGEFEVRVSGEATEDLWGEFYHRPAVEQSDGTRSEWRGEATVTA